MTSVQKQISYSKDLVRCTNTYADNSGNALPPRGYTTVDMDETPKKGSIHSTGTEPDRESAGPHRLRDRANNKGRITMRNLNTYIMPEYLVTFMDDQQAKSHQRNIENKKRLMKAIRRRERIRAGLAFGGLILSFCGIAAIESADIATGPVICCLIGMLFVLVSTMILKDDSNV